jgi:hypothetical protein
MFVPNLEIFAIFISILFGDELRESVECYHQINHQHLSLDNS